jgi:hypothetical protein
LDSEKEQQTMTLITSLILLAIGYALGRLPVAHYLRTAYNRVARLLVSMADDLPDTATLPIATGTLAKSDRSWAIAGYYLVHTGSGLESQYLTAYARWLMGRHADVLPLNRATVKTAYTAFTPNHKPYQRFRTERTWHLAVDYTGFVYGVFIQAPELESNLGLLEVAA